MGRYLETKIRTSSDKSKRTSVNYFDYFT